MVDHRLGKTQQVILLSVLALCLVAMHHVSTSGSMTRADVAHVEMTATTAGSGEHHPGMPDGAHTLLHLCLAVMCAAVALLLALLLLGRARPAEVATPASPRGSPAPGRPPDRRGRLVLTSLCVLRT